MCAARAKSTQTVKKINEPLVFGLDIGTRSIVGTVGYYKSRKFHVIAMETIEHEDRVMIDGQIHDIGGVAAEIKIIKKRLSTTLGQELKDVCIAAAGRVLRTVTTHVEKELGEDRDISPEDVYSLEILGAQKAYSDFVKDNDLRIHFYCVGYTVERYFLNQYPMGNLENHKGHLIGADLIATFLPDEVVDGLYKAVELAGLHVANLTLEPIAAMEVAIPKSYRMLNIALVDVGAGTSDICITRDEAIIAYGMIPSAGDEITETIAKAYLTDFSVAEEIKRDIGEKNTIKYQDIMGIEHKVNSETVSDLVKPVMQIMTREISDKIKKLNGGKPVSAVFVVGGGGRVPGFTDLLAEELGLAPERVAIRGEEVLGDVDFQVDVRVDSLIVTPIGICLNFYNTKNNFIFVYFNGEQLKLYDNSALRISDAAMQAGFPNSDLFPKHGMDITFTVNGRKRIRRGESGEAAVIKLNGQVVSITEKIKAGDDIEVTPSTSGKAATVELQKLPEFSDKITVIVNGQSVVLPKFAMVNGELQSGYYEVKDGDTVEMCRYYTVQQILDFMDVNLEQGEQIYVNHEIASPLTEVYDNFSVEWTFAEEELHSDLKDKKDSKEGKSKTAKSEAASAKEEKAKEDVALSVIVNGSPVTLTGKASYMFVDVFRFIDFDLSKPQGKYVVTQLNGNNAEFAAPLKTGDDIAIYWKE
ncbi:MAG: cell division protein FtsA [Lachnospiraceae bacterium]|nr:cell division protein FtsA [Lachnospiraceae bacterium]